MGVQTGVPFGEEGGSASGKEMPAVCKEWLCVFRGPEGCRRFFVVLEAFPLRLGSGEKSGKKRAESGEGALREPFGGGGGGRRLIFCKFLFS